MKVLKTKNFALLEVVWRNLKYIHLVTKNCCYTKITSYAKWSILEHEI